MEQLLHVQKTSLPLDVSLSLIRDVASGLAFLHASRPALVHGELACCVLLRSIALDATAFRKPQAIQHTA